MGTEEDRLKIASRFDLHAKVEEKVKPLNEAQLEQLGEIGIDPEKTSDEALEVALNILNLYIEAGPEADPIMTGADMALKRHAIQGLAILREQGVSLPQENKGVEVFPGDGEF